MFAYEWERGVTAAETAEHSRMRTVMEAISRTRITSEIMNVFVLGAAGAEVSELQISLICGAVIACLEHRGVKFTELKVLFVGLNVPVEMDGKVIQIEDKVVVKLFNREYHKLPLAEGEQVPSIVFMFNAGIWGYESWIPTIQKLCSFPEMPVVITSFNEEEADHDHEKLQQVLPKYAKWIWKVERNPFGSLKFRWSGIKDRCCADNQFWQCFKPGQMQDENNPENEN